MHSLEKSQTMSSGHAEHSPKLNRFVCRARHVSHQIQQTRNLPHRSDVIISLFSVNTSLLQLYEKQLNLTQPKMPPRKNIVFYLILFCIFIPHTLLILLKTCFCVLWVHLITLCIFISLMHEPSKGFVINGPIIFIKPPNVFKPFWHI